MSINYIYCGEIDCLNHKVGFELFYAVMPVYAILMTIICLGNVQKTLTLQRIIAVIRFFVIALMIYGASYYIFDQDDINRDIELFNVDYFGYLIGNVILAFMWHHSLPNIVRPIRPELKAKTSII